MKQLSYSLLVLAVALMLAGEAAVAQEPDSRVLATGSAHIDAAGAGWRTLALHAVENAGVVDGQMELRTDTGSAFVRAGFDCAAEGIDDYLILSGPVLTSSDPAFHACKEAGTERCLGAIAVKDNGQGRYAEPDELTFYISFFGFDEAVGGPLCEFLSFGPPPFIRLQAESGNIQVHVDPGDL